MFTHRHVFAGKLLLTMIVATVVAIAAERRAAAEIDVAEIKHDGPVDFDKEVLPILRRNCLACHNATDAESDLVLEKPEDMREGGATGPAVIPGKSEESLLFALASHRDAPLMPPEDNDVGAKNLTPEQLGLLKLWIDQGAKDSASGTAGPIQWQPLPATVNPVYAVAVSPHGKYVAAGRANQIFIYSVPAQAELTRLTDPALLEQGLYDKPGVAHLDIVQSLAFSPDGRWLASGGYRTVKLWQRPQNPQKNTLQGIDGPPQSLAVSADGKWAAVGESSGNVKLFDLATGKAVKTLGGHSGPVNGVAFSSDSALLASGSQDKTFRVFNVADGKEVGNVETPAPVNAVAFVLENKQIATGHADNKLFTWHMPGTEPAPEKKEAEDGESKDDEQEQAGPQPIKEFGGHSGPITSLIALAEGKQLLSGSEDSTMRHWDAAGGNQIRQFNPGGPVAAVAVSPDGSKFAAACKNNVAKIFRSDNGQELGEMRGDHRTRLARNDADRALALAKQHVENAKKDLDQAEKRKKSEEENAKKAEENKKQAEEEMKKKEEAAKKPVEEKKKADEALAAIKPQFEQAEADKTKAEEAAEKAKEAQDAAQKKRDEANKAADEAKKAADEAAGKLEEAQKNAKAAADKLTEAQNAAKEKPDDKALADAVKTAEEEKAKADEAVKAAEKAKAEADAALEKANEAKAAAEKDYNEAVAKNEEAQKAKNEANDKFNDLKNKFEQAEKNVKQKAGPAQKATDELNAAVRAYEAAARSVKRSQEAVQRATEAVPEYEAALKQREEQAAQRQKEKEAADKAAPESEKPILAVAFTSDGRAVATGGEDAFVHMWSAENGRPLKVYEGNGAAVTALAATPGGGMLALGQNGSAIVWDTAPQWELVRTIGSPDSSEQFVDRVTALHFSPDSQLLATGGGEPSRSGELKIWNVEDGSLVREIEDAHSDTLFDVEFSPNGELIASCAADRFAKVHRVDNGEFVRAFEGHTHHVMGVSWQADGRRLATSGADKAVKVWDAQTGDQEKTITGWKKEVTAIKFVAIKDEMITAAGDPQVSLRDTNGRNRGGFSGPDDFVYTVRVSADGKTIVAGGQSSVVRVWNEKRDVIATFEPPEPKDASQPDGNQQAAK